MSHSYSKKELTEYFFETLDMFGDRLDNDITPENLHVEFFNVDNCVEVYEQFCSAHFPNMLKDISYKVPGYFETVAAQAFVNETEYGVLINENIDFTLGEVLQVFLHEISHLYCTRNEIESGDFFDKYCMGSGPEDGMMNAGYAVWREAIADIMADSMISDFSTTSIGQVKNLINDYYKMLTPNNPQAKKAMSLIIAFVMISSEVASTTNWIIAEKAIRRSIKIEDKLFYSILEQVFEQLHHRAYWKITPEYIMTLGETYLSLITHIFLTSQLNK